MSRCREILLKRFWHPRLNFFFFLHLSFYIHEFVCALRKTATNHLKPNSSSTPSLSQLAGRQISNHENLPVLCGYFRENLYLSLASLPARRLDGCEVRPSGSPSCSRGSTWESCSLTAGHCISSRGPHPRTRTTGLHAYLCEPYVHLHSGRDRGYAWKYPQVTWYSL